MTLHYASNILFTYIPKTKTIQVKYYWVLWSLIMFDPDYVMHHVLLDTPMKNTLF